MKAGLNQLLKNFQAAEAALVAAMPTITKMYANDVTSLTIARIQTEGIKGKAYSTEEMYAGPTMFNRKAGFKPRGKNTENNQTQTVFDIGTKKKKRVAIKEDFTERKTMYLESGYQELRQLNGLQSSVVDATFSGRLMQNIQVLGVQEKSTGNYIAKIGPTDADNKNKFSGLNKKYPNFFKPNTEDINTSVPAAKAAIVKVLQQYLPIKKK